MTPFEKFVLAHLTADFLLQNNWMALNKSKQWTPALVHFTLYGIVMGLAFLSWQIGLVAAVLHGIVDKWSLGELWLRLIRGRSFQSLKAIPTGMLCSDGWTPQVLYIAFTAVVYTTTDFLLHVVTTYPVVVWMMRNIKV